MPQRQVARPHGKTATPRCKILSVGKILRISPSVLLPGRRVRFLLRPGKGCIDMHGRACCALIFLLLLPAPSRAEGTCVEPESLAHSTVSITRYFDDAERAADPGFIGARGTGWFLSPTTIVTVGHVAAGMNLSTRDWKELEILDGDRSQTASARILRLAGSNAEKLAVLELRTAISAARSFAIRTAPLTPDEHVMTLAYPDGRLRLAGGRFVQYGDGERLTGTALLEMYDGNDRLAVDYGASGAPVVDCAGRVAAVVSDVVTQTLRLPFREVRISTAWGTPNVVSVPVQALSELALKEFSQAE